MFKSIKKIKDKLYYLYIDKVVNTPEALNSAKDLGGFDIDDKNTLITVIEADIAVPAIVDTDPVSLEETVIEDNSISNIESVEQIKKKPGRPKSTTKTTTKSTTKKVPTKKVD